ncbi:MAG: hypothetical protein KJ077_12385 [Anaerolineae bacterium]|nr:hypothetical protein [Anaerolineae bacterium]
MFNYTDPKPMPITSRQAAFLGKLLTQYGKERYRAAKRRLGIPADVTLLKLTKAQAHKLIDELKEARR